MGIIRADRFQIAERIAQITEQKTPSNEPEVQSLLSDLQRFYPPVSPRFVTAPNISLQPVTMDSPLQMRFLVEFFAESFRQEATILFDKPLDLQYSAFRRGTEFEAWLMAVQDFRLDIKEHEAAQVAASENINAVWEALGCCLFYRDKQLTQEQQKQSEWIGAFAWVHPHYRRTGLLKAIWDSFEKYGDFWIEGPVSEEMKRFMGDRNISIDRVLDPDRYKKDQEQPSDDGLSES